ncbi:FGGY-family carbohydrate kinase [Solicola sp. PLA-1-18]|uniref:FGGY-family carbohydrate kinase n=1 Tax=Solicola sp. PLA-1-18 TaxID=3380532 RepID=UPI003B7D43B1
MSDPGSTWIGIDLGTQSVRVIAVRGDGEVVGRGSSALTSHRDGPRHEQDPEQWWTAVCEASRHATADVDSSTVRGVATDGTSGTVLLTDDAGTPLTPGLMYDDARAPAQAAAVNAAGAEVWSSLGYQRMQVSWGLPKLLWLLDTRRVTADAGPVRLAHQVDVVNRRLVGRPVATDLSNALKTGADLRGGCWPREVMDRLGVPDDVLPDLVPPGSRLGQVGEAGAEATGIPAGTPVVAGTTDGCASQLGAGVVDVGSWNSVLGTTLVLKGVTAAPLADPNGVVYSHRGPAGRWLPGGASSSGAGVVPSLFPGADLDALTDGARAHEPSSCLTYPLVSEGERFPFVAPAARAFEIGRVDGDADRFASVLQGVAHVERLCYDYLDLLGAPLDGDVVLTGGASGNDYWCQLRADVLGRDVRVPADATPALGMAVLAAGGEGDPAPLAAAMTGSSRTFSPRTSRDRLVPGYVALVDQLEERGWLDPDVAAHARKRADR